MTYPHQTGGPQGAGTDASPQQPAAATWTVRRRPAAPAPTVPTRRYEVSWISHRGEEHSFTRAAPALPVFEKAFSAFARGTLITTARGPVAVEDLIPGDMIETVDGAHVPLRWKGAMTLLPHATRPDAAPERLYRVSADTFGIGRPAPDLVLGPHARYLMRAHMLKNYLGTGEALVPIAAMADGMSVIEVAPISAVPCYHLGLDRHALISANGVEVESYHPGANTASKLMGDLRGQFLMLFPHIQEMADFGPMCQPRLSAGDIDQMNAA